MADTERSKSALLTLLADNTVGAISPQDLRDVLVSLINPFGSFYVSSPAGTSITQAGTYVKAAGTTTANNLSSFTMPASNRLTYTGTATRHFHIATHLSFTSSTGNRVIGVQLAVDGTALPNSTHTVKIGTGSDTQAMSLHWDAMMSSNQYIELFITDTQGTNTITLSTGYLFALGMLT